MICFWVWFQELWLLQISLVSLNWFDIDQKWSGLNIRNRVHQVFGIFIRSFQDYMFVFKFQWNSCILVSCNLQTFFFLLQTLAGYFAMPAKLWITKNLWINSRQSKSLLMLNAFQLYKLFPLFFAKSLIRNYEAYFTEDLPLWQL